MLECSGSQSVQVSALLTPCLMKIFNFIDFMTMQHYVACTS